MGQTKAQRAASLRNLKKAQSRARHLRAARARRRHLRENMRGEAPKARENPIGGLGLLLGVVAVAGLGVGGYVLYQKYKAAQALPGPVATGENTAGNGSGQAGRPQLSPPTKPPIDAAVPPVNVVPVTSSPEINALLSGAAQIASSLNRDPMSYWH